MLNTAQEAFCSAPPGQAIRLLAPAGCGKTQSLLWRCRDLHARAQGQRFLLIAFTTAACEELRERVRDDPSLAPVAPGLTVRTLNSWGLRRLKSERPNLKVLTQTEHRTFAVLNQLGSVVEQYPRILKQLQSARKVHRSGQLLDAIDALKTLGFRHDRVSPKALEEHLGFLRSCGLDRHVSILAERLADADLVTDGTTACLFDEYMPFFAAATSELYKQSVITFDDQKYWAFIDLQKQLAKGSFWQGAVRSDHIFIDEFQDINPLDLALVRGISDINQTPLTIVGDDDQAIYEWRAATPDFILGPEQFLKRPYETIKLETNYRSPRNLVDMSQRLIRHNVFREDKAVSATAVVDARVEPLLVDDLSSAIDTVLDFVRAHPEYRSIALVARKRAQIVPYQVAFASNDTPFYAAEDLQVFLTDAFKSVLELLYIHQRQSVDASEYGVDPVTDLLKLCDLVATYPLQKANRERLLKHLQAGRSATPRQALARLSTFDKPLSGKNQGAGEAEQVSAAITRFFDAESVWAALEAMSENFVGLQRHYGKAQENIFYADPPFAHLAEFARRYDTDFKGFARDLKRAFETLARTKDEDEEITPKPVVRLMTALRAKGKEFDAVIVLDANERIWPAAWAQDDRQQEAERRLFYVAVTRAKKHLVILSNKKLYGRDAMPTPYLTEMGLVAGVAREG